MVLSSGFKNCSYHPLAHSLKLVQIGRALLFKPTFIFGDFAMSTRSVRYAIILGVALAVSGAAFYVLSPAEATDAAPAAAALGKEPKLVSIIKADAVYATVNGSKITGADVQAFIKNLPEQIQAAAPASLLEVIVNQMANDRLVEVAAEKTDLTDDAAVAKSLAAAKAQVLRDAYVKKQLEGKLTDAALRKKYEEMLFNTGRQEEIKAAHILVKDEAKAKELIDQLNKGADFAKLAKENSLDGSKDNGGDLGYFVKASMVKEFGDAAFALKKDAYTKTPVKTQFGYHIIKLEDRRAQAKPEFDQVKDRVQAQLQEDEVRKIVETLRKDAKIEVTVPAAGKSAQNPVVAPAAK